MNPLGKDGQPQRCHSCGSFRHLQAKCPDRFETFAEGVQDQGHGFKSQLEEVVGEDEEQFVGLNTFEVFNAQVGVIKAEEVFASVVLDTGCVKSVAGKNWFNDFVSTLTQKTKDSIKPQFKKKSHINSKNNI